VSESLPDKLLDFAFFFSNILTFFEIFYRAYEYAVDLLDKTYVPLFHQSEEVRRSVSVS